ncbi:Immunoglobulin heavy variable 3-7 [Plecturocebus cupreus]
MSSSVLELAERSLRASGVQCEVKLVESGEAWFSLGVPETLLCSLWIHLHSSYWMGWVCQAPGKEPGWSHPLMVAVVAQY